MSWEISNANFTKPYCTLNCKNGNDSCPKVTRKEDGYAANAADYINGIRAIRTVTMEDYYDSHNLAPVDDVFIKDQAGQPSFELEAGNQYTISCCEATEPFNILNPCKDNTNRQGPVKTIAGCGGPCEVPSSVIFENLLKGNHINISETNFRDWGINQQVDNANLSNNLGSGDLEDIKNAMSVSQACFGFVSQIDPVNDIGEMVIRDIKKITDKLKPASVNIIYKPSVWSGIFGHSIIVLKITETSNDNFILKVLDGVYPHVYEMNCRYQSTFLQDNYIYTIVCDHPIEGFGVIILRQNLNIINELSQSFFSYCYQHSNSDFCISRQNMSLWLENNYPPIENFSDANGGVCVGWSDFMLRVAYLGDFVGYDYHPNDGKMVGIDCDENHYPITKSASAWDPANWLASVSQILTKLWRIGK